MMGRSILYSKAENHFRNAILPKTHRYGNPFVICGAIWYLSATAIDFAV